MPRSKPESSWAVACRHLFRHFNDPGELERNPIYQRFLNVNCGRGTSGSTAFAALRSSVERAARDYELKAIAKGKPDVGRRARQIVLANVLRGLPLDRVASDLHLSRSQVYRERRAVCRFVAGIIGGTPKVEVMKSPIDVAEITLIRGQSLVHACELDRAITLFEKVAYEAGSAARRIEAFCLAAETHTSQMMFERARSCIREADAITAQEAGQLSNERANLCRLRIAYANVLLGAGESGIGTVTECLRDLLAELKATYRDDAAFLNLQFDVLFFACDRSRFCGSFVLGRRYLSAARSAFAEIRDPKLEQHLRLVRLESMLCNDQGTEITFEAALQAQLAARNLSLKHGLILAAVEASLNLALIYGFGLGDFPRAFAEIQPMMTWIVPNNAQIAGQVAMTLVDLYIGNGQYSDAVKLLESSEVTSLVDRDTKALVQCLLANAYYGLRRYEQAIESAELAYTMSQTDNKRFQSAALRTSALAHFYQGHLSKARERIAGALELGASSQGRTSAAFTHLASATITGDRSHARLAKSLNRNVRLR